MAKDNQDFISSAAWEDKPPDFLALTPLDGRNYHKLQALIPYFSDFALTRERLKIEIEYLLFLSTLKLAPPLSLTQKNSLKKIYLNFSLPQAESIRVYEHQTNHDLKAIEYYLRDQLKTLHLTELTPYLHWALASEDVNNLAYSLLLKEFLNQSLKPLIQTTLAHLTDLAQSCYYPMLGVTHGQPAAVTSLAKELCVFLSRANTELNQLIQVRFDGKINGSVGSLSDQTFATPQIDWSFQLSRFIEFLGLKPVLATTQILPYESYLRFFDTVDRLQNVAIDLCQNFWWYLHFGYFTQKISHREIGSSVMPQKINPIYFEGAEGGFELSNSLLSFYRHKLSRSRLQRDLSDSTVRRSFGIAFGYSYLSWQSVIEALVRLTVNPKALSEQLESHYEILTSALQTYLRLHGFTDAYETVSQKVKGKTFSQSTWQNLLLSLNLDSATLTYCQQHLNFATLAKPANQIASQVIQKLSS